MEPVSFGGEPISDSNVDPVGSQETEAESFGNPFLSEVAAQHRDIVAPYLKKWDGNATRKFQEYSSKLKPYEQLGTHEELTKYTNFVKNFRQQPEAIFKLMWEGFQNQYGENFETELLRILQIQAEEQQQMNDYQEYGEGNEPDPSEVFQQNVMQELNELREWRQAQEDQQTFAEQNAQLDNVLQGLHNQHGDFDDTWVITRIAEHGDPNRAIQEFNAMVGKFSGNKGTPRQAPKTMGGQGGVPTNTVDPSKLRKADRRNAVLSMLQAGKE